MRDNGRSLDGDLGRGWKPDSDYNRCCTCMLLLQGKTKEERKRVRLF